MGVYLCYDRPLFKACQHILDVLKSVSGSRKKAVEKLGISERTLRYKLQQYRDEGWVE